MYMEGQSEEWNECHKEIWWMYIKKKNKYSKRATTGQPAVGR